MRRMSCRLWTSAGSLLAAMILCGAPAAVRAENPELRDLLKTFHAEFVAITPGQGDFPQSFLMGTAAGADTEAPAHTVTFKHTFAMAKYEVPQNLYEAVMGANPSKWKGKRNSAEMFSYHDAVAFCTRATTLLREAQLLAADEEIRLPSEAEWEYCCRAGTKTAYSFGDSAVKDGDVAPKASLLDVYGWHTGNAAGNDPPVGAKKPNAWGLYDFHGYLWEFVSDDWHDSYAGAPTDGHSWTGPETHKKVIRGGSWKDRYDLLRSAARRSIADDAQDDAVGFRCVKAKVPATPRKVEGKP
ncbi:MAG: formylglycine-generating enzyme family protein [Planctomycetes bacterium]|nr:formylglycine-generating enzyme family protein [Planctomycetota bacterium]